MNRLSPPGFNKNGAQQCAPFLLKRWIDESWEGRMMIKLI
jgi:hypothetical protein